MFITDENGNQIEVFTQEEMSAKAEAEARALAEKAEAERAALEEKYKAELEEKDRHIAEKLNEFLTGKKGVAKKEEELTEKEREALQQMEEARRISQEALDSVAKIKLEGQEKIKNFYLAQASGGDEATLQKIKESYDLINVEIKSDEDIVKRVELAMKMAGVTVSSIPEVSFGSVGQAPQFNSSADQNKEQAYDNFISEMGLQKPTNK